MKTICDKCGKVLQDGASQLESAVFDSAIPNTHKNDYEGGIIYAHCEECWGPLNERHTTIQEFETVYRKDYAQELESCDAWIKWCERQNDTHGMNFHQGMRAAHIFNNIKMEQLLSVLKQERPNVNSGHNKTNQES